MFSHKITEHILKFKTPAKTSRNTFKERRINIVEVANREGVVGMGEAAPLSLLSVDDVEGYQEQLHREVVYFSDTGLIDPDRLLRWPSIQFALESVEANLKSGKKHLWFDTDFVQGRPILINGLVWMSGAEQMWQQSQEKMAQGFKCIKIKVGALDFDEECRLLEKIRKKASAFQVELRLDANGGFHPHEAKEQLQTLKRFEIHSIEQPIKPNQWDVLSSLTHQNIIPIALDEELIGRDVYTEGKSLLQHIKPQYIILKPNLLGGFSRCDEWIIQSGNLNIGWWATSALESNIGLSAIAQWASTHPLTLPQGLGTGSLFENNIETGITVDPPFVRWS